MLSEFSKNSLTDNYDTVKIVFNITYTVLKESGIN